MEQYKNYWVSGWATPFSTYARGDVCTVEPNGHTVVVKQFEPREEFPTRQAAAAVRGSHWEVIFAISTR